MDETIEEQIIPEVYDWNTSLLSEVRIQVLNSQFVKIVR